jgi:hypothetical protein
LLVLYRRRVIASREAPIEVHYQSLGTYHEIYEHYLIVRRIKNEILCIYIRTFVGHISLYRVFEVHYFLKWFKSLSAHKIGLNPLMR